jgi:hypothetical protein
MKNLCLTICVLFLVGCGARSELAGVAGRVTFDGQAVTDGQVAFEPVGEGRMGFAIVSNGSYRLDAMKGLAPGKYLVRITASRPTGKNAEQDSFLKDTQSLAINEQYIPPKYNSGSQLEIEIEAIPENQRDFDLRSD